MSEPKRAAIINLGCKVNKYEADSMGEKLSDAGFRIVDPEEVADVYIVNTCSVTNMAQKKSRQMLRRAKKRNPDAVIVAAGCYVNAEHDVLKAEDFVDVVVSNNCKKDIVEVLAAYYAEHNRDFYTDVNRKVEYEEMGNLRAAGMEHHTRAYIKIQDGCNQFCSYCIIPYTRGRVRSRRPEAVLEEIRQLAKEGVAEFVLTGIHISSYGLDFEETPAAYDTRAKEEGCSHLEQLILAIAAIPEVKRIRLGSLEPRIVTMHFVKSLSREPKFCPHFHLSLQSACNATLKRMNRKYTIEEFEDTCRLLREYFDMPAITTDVIVGFPGEAEEEFATTLANLERLQLYEIHVFKYSVREGTVAQRMPDQVDERIKNRRSEVLLSLTAAQKKAYEEQMHGRTEEVLFEEPTGAEEPLPVVVNAGEKTDRVTERDGAALVWYTGHTGRYVKVKMAANEELQGQVRRVTFV